jgi:hypothetical protein
LLTCDSGISVEASLGKLQLVMMLAISRGRNVHVGIFEVFSDGDCVGPPRPVCARHSPLGKSLGHDEGDLSVIPEEGFQVGKWPHVSLDSESEMWMRGEVSDNMVMPCL